MLWRRHRHRFVVLPKRWIVERTPAWIGRCRRLPRDYEGQACKAATFVRLAMIRLMLRRCTVNQSLQRGTDFRNRFSQLASEARKVATWSAKAALFMLIINAWSFSI